MKRPLQDILPPSTRRTPRRSLTPPMPPEPAPQAKVPPRLPPRVPIESMYDAPRPRRRRRVFVWVAGAFAILLLSIAFSFLFKGATITITPHLQTIVVDKAITAVGVSGEGVPYEVMTLENSASRTLTASGEEEVEERAKGRIVVYNAYSTNSQRLITNTRFQATDGLIFRIQSPVIIPGKRTVNGEEIPGSIEIEVIADEPGEKYNIELTDFVIPGFKGSPQYDKFYGRSKSPMSGGYVGTRQVVAPTDLAAARSEMQAELTEKLAEEAHSQVPPGYKLFSSATRITFVPGPQTPEGTKVILSEKGTLVGILLPEEALIRELTPTLDEELSRSTLAFQNTDDLTAALPGLEGWSSLDKQNLEVRFRGSAQIRAVIDPAALATSLAGESRGNLETIIKTSYPGISTARASIRPAWSRSFPEESEDIKVVEAISPESN